MNEEKIKSLLTLQREFYRSGATLPIAFRKDMLKKLYMAVKAHEKDICEALYSDLGKSEREAFMCEAGLALTEIRYMMKNVKRFSRERTVKTPLAQFKARSYEKPSPYGNVLIMSPWNYPFLLSIEPLANAIAAGNTAIIKPSAYSPATSKLIEKIIRDNFPPEYVTTVTGGRAENSALLKQNFDFIFFTGSGGVGKEVLRNAAENLTPCVLELGGKSPCIVDDTAKIPLAAKRIVFGKLINCGQTCVAPDYILCDKRIKEKLLDEIIRQIKMQYGDEPLKNQSYGHIVNEKHFDRILSLIDGEKVAYGGGYDREALKIEPTVMVDVSFEDKVMGEEIFGPVLPIITYDNFEDIFDILAERDKPLALYIFSESRSHIKQITERISYGGGCINDTIIHLATSEMGFGGVGESGMGSYHGKRGFDTFSHVKSIVDKKTWIDLPIRYQPYKSKFYEKLIRLFLK